MASALARRGSAMVTTVVSSTQTNSAAATTARTDQRRCIAATPGSAAMSAGTTSSGASPRRAGDRLEQLLHNREMGVAVDVFVPGELQREPLKSATIARAAPRDRKPRRCDLRPAPAGSARPASPLVAFMPRSTSARIARACSASAQPCTPTRRRSCAAGSNIDPA